MPTVTAVDFYSDGCATQYKNYKNMLNLCRHKNDFGIDATWVFFASPCDGIGCKAELQKSCGYAGITREEGLPYVKSVRKV